MEMGKCHSRELFEVWVRSCDYEIEHEKLKERYAYVTRLNKLHESTVSDVASSRQNRCDGDVLHHRSRPFPFDLFIPA